MNRELRFMLEAIELSRKGISENQGGPFGCVIVRGDEVVGSGWNKVTSTNDPTAHAEVVAIRDACERLQTFQLQDCEVFTSCEPCPMCMGAIYWARPKRVVYANTKQDAAAIAFDDDFIYKEINAGMADRKIPFIHFPHPQALEVFNEWKTWAGKKIY